jgi:hypothetical protein
VATAGYGSWGETGGVEKEEKLDEHARSSISDEDESIDHRVVGALEDDSEDDDRHD